jgi:hypothetical protein
MRLRPGQHVAGHGPKATADRADRIFRETDEGSHRCRPFVVEVVDFGHGVVLTKAEAELTCPCGVQPASFCGTCNLFSPGLLLAPVRR